MPEYIYIARDRQGQLVEGTIVAENSAMALGKVRQMGYEVEKVRSVEQAAKERAGVAPAHPAGLTRRFQENFLFPAASGVSLKELALFYRQFATLIHAGFPLYQALVTLESQTKNRRLKEVIRASQRQVQAGGKLSDVFAAHSWIFSELQLEMLRAAEHGGILDDILHRIADYLEQELSLRRLISRLTLYPKIVVLSALFILGPKFFLDGTPAISKLIIAWMGQGSYSGAQYLMDTVGFLAIALLIGSAAVAFCRITLFQSDTARESYERLKMSLPWLGTVVRAFALAKFGRAFGAMYAAGLPIQQAIRVGGNASGSRIIARAAGRAILATERGALLSQAFQETGVFPKIVIDMLHTGEQTGNLDAMMSKAAEYLEGEAESKAHLYAHVFATAVYLTVAVMVGYAVIQFALAGGYGSLGGGALDSINDGGG
jgi:type II secretory pathway component PulF